MEPADTYHSTHCDKCFNFAHCNKIRSLRKSRPNEDLPCPIIHCRACGHQFHACKKSEHELLCPKINVPCINKEFGCPLILERGKRGKHLETCPASVIVCTMEWNRWPLPPGKSQPFELNSAQLDVAGLLRDEKTLSDWKEFVPPTLRYLLKTHMNSKPVIPLGVSGLRIPKSILNQTIIEQNLKLETDNSESTEDESSDSAPWGCRSPPGLQESVCTKLRSLNVTNSENNNAQNVQKNPLDNMMRSGNKPQLSNEVDIRSPPILVEIENYENGEQNGHSELSNNGCENGCVPNKKKNVSLSLTVEVRTRCQRKPSIIYTFMCCREFRRDEYPCHFSQIHSGIHTQLNGWLFTRCPMSYLGCEFGLQRMQPNDENYNIVYNSTANAFCFTQKMQNTCLSKYSVKQTTLKTEKTTVSLSSLPFELLVHLTKYLDPLSLNSLSMTNRLFRDAASCVVVERGIVVLQWEKKKTGLGWEVVDKKWIFSSAFSPIRKWKFGDTGRMITHMKTCPFFERNIPSKPFAYPITKEQL